MPGPSSIATDHPVVAEARRAQVPAGTLAVTLTVAQLREIVREEIQAARAPEHGPDRLLDAEEAAKMLSMSTDWLYRHAKKLPFTRKLGPKMLRFSYKGIVKWLESRKVN